MSTNLSNITQYRNPPVVEVGIFFDFYPSEKTPQWNEETAKAFFQHQEIEKEFSNVEEIYKQQFYIKSNLQDKTASTTVFTPTIDEILARDKKSSMLSLGKNQLAYRLGRKDNEFPHYNAVEQSIFEILPIYNEFWKPERITNISLSYVDIVKIPEQRIDLDEYFLLNVSFPEAMGETNFVEGRVVFSDEYGYKDVMFRSKPSENKSDGTFQFFWTARQQLDKEAQNKNEIKNVMEKLHEGLRDSFERSFTDKCKKLFDPF
ncbi:MAG: TIGR04255 family protein [Planctomycetaceae bacterium]|jgi:uncharacterized protein (TIGR04255 family)|nr:TIGR04255 family protein [Planctomycetaceae bacterium]